MGCVCLFGWPEGERERTYVDYDSPAVNDVELTLVVVQKFGDIPNDESGPLSMVINGDL